ncbi:hypothetical protein LCGC14_2602780, partial [marine sediment metagenome]
YDDHLRVVPTNIGWRADGCNVMGRGVARQAAERCPELAEWYGGQCRKMSKAGRTLLAYFKPGDLVMLPVKPLDEIQPHLSWRGEADPVLVERSIMQLAKTYFMRDVVLPLVGCGNGGLDPAVVIPVLKDYLRTDNFTLVLTPASFRELVIVKALLP